MSEPVPYRRADASSPPALFPDYRSTGLRAPRQPLIEIPQTLKKPGWNPGFFGAALGR